MKIWAFVAEIFAKQYWCFLIIDFQCIFDISALMHLQSLQRWIITECLWIFFKTRSQNVLISVQWKHQSELIFCILRLSHKHITFDSSPGTPCSFLKYTTIFQSTALGLHFKWKHSSSREHSKWRHCAS